MNTVQKFEAKQLAQLQGSKEIPAFGPGDTVKVNVKIKEEGGRERIQAYEGICIGRSGGGLTETFTVRKISYGEGVERVFPLWSPFVDSVELVRRGSIRRAKLYYLRDLRGKSARISERTEGYGLETVDTTEQVSKTEKARAKKELKAAKKAAPKAPKVKKKKEDAPAGDAS